ncbi:SPOR domain-containing protein [Carboxylicivirga sediminis]|uniref:SPOR domain-containing protein n=1 Tax=Carboxylicivirga sediminis TaxID=2006564 RepID=A0A941F2N1_9BACT|nr:SPOR domain-containing protein [Carboxylicivirga sediminis]MBR8535232.1 SPOR domain-containing protein [Carboxylicivirga sediminis]
MQQFKFLTLTVLSIVVVSCASLNNGSSSFDDSDSPYVQEETTPVVKEEPAPKTDKIVVKEEKVKVVDEPETEVFKYYVIIGSFRVLENAQNYKKQLSGEGFLPVLLENENGLYRVSVSAYNDEMPARERISAIRSKYDKYDDVWLLIRRS